MGPNGRVEVPMRVVLRYRSVAAVANAVAAGIGLGPVPAITFDDPVFKNIVFAVLTEHTFAEATLYFVYVSRSYVPLKIRTFTDFIMKSAGRFPLPKVPASL
jgi:DNA-binding transcriptional LysR family regulator